MADKAVIIVIKSQINYLSVADVWKLIIALKNVRKSIGLSTRKEV